MCLVSANHGTCFSQWTCMQIIPDVCVSITPPFACGKRVDAIEIAGKPIRITMKWHPGADD